MEANLSDDSIDRYPGIGHRGGSLFLPFHNMSLYLRGIDTKVQWTLSHGVAHSRRVTFTAMENEHNRRHETTQPQPSRVANSGFGPTLKRTDSLDK
jgi:hypothetical protein